MQTYVVYFYHALGNVGNIIAENKDESFRLESSSLIGITNRKFLELNHNNGNVLRPFEIQQDRLDALISMASNLKVQILKIEFDQIIDPELDEELSILLFEHRYEQLSRIIDDLHNNGVDIFAITFMFEGRQFRVTKYAVAEMTGEWNEIPMLAANSPVAFIAGVKRVPWEGMPRQ